MNNPSPAQCRGNCLEGFVCRQLVTGLMKEPHYGGLGKMLTQQQHGAENQAATHS